MEEDKKLRIDWSKVLTNAISVLVATVFLGAAVQVYDGYKSIDDRIEQNVRHLEEAQNVMAPKLDRVEQQLDELLSALKEQKSLNEIEPIAPPGEERPSTREEIQERLRPWNMRQQMVAPRELR